MDSVNVTQNVNVYFIIECFHQQYIDYICYNSYIILSLSAFINNTLTTYVTIHLSFYLWVISSTIHWLHMLQFIYHFIFECFHQQYSDYICYNSCIILLLSAFIIFFFLFTYSRQEYWSTMWLPVQMWPNRIQMSRNWRSKNVCLYRTILQTKRSRNSVYPIGYVLYTNIHFTYLEYVLLNQHTSLTR